MDVDYRRYYDLETYLFETVGPTFTRQGFLSAFDFFCIVIWKANRAKSKVAKRLLARGNGDLEAAVRALTTGLAEQRTARDRLRYLWQRDAWDLALPMATAILTVLYPGEFTVYDVRVCDALGDFHTLRHTGNFDRLWRGYERFKAAVEQAAPPELSLRDKDRYLWGKSFHEQLVGDLRCAFSDDRSGADS